MNRHPTPPNIPHITTLLRSPFLFKITPPTKIYTLSLHDALPISTWIRGEASIPLASLFSSEVSRVQPRLTKTSARSEEHTSELQSRFELVCRLLLEKKKTASK